MSLHPQATKAYQGVQRAIEPLRETEARALLSCANRLAMAQASDATYDMYLDAVRHNQHLWTIFQVALCEPSNPLPRDLKITLLTLSKFVDKVSLRAQVDYNPSMLTSLIDINRNLAAGLSVGEQATGDTLMTGLPPIAGGETDTASLASYA